MIEILKLIGSALVTACCTIYALHVKRIWELKDRSDGEKKSVEDKIDDMTDRMESLVSKVDALEAKIDELSNDFDTEKEVTDLKNRCLQAGLREMLYDRIKYLSKKYISDGKIREEDYKSLKRMWAVYHEDLEGNGYLDEEMQKVEKLEKY